MAHPWTGMRCPICNTTMQSNDDVRRITSDAINKHHITDHAQVAQGDYAHHKCIKKPEIHVARGEIEQLRARRRLLEAQIEQKTARIQQLQSEPRPRQYGLPSAPTSSSQHPAAASALPGQPSGQHPSIESYTNGIPEELKSNCDFVVPFSTAYAQTQQYFSSVPQTTTTTTSTTVVLRSARQQSYVQRLYDELLNVNNRINGMQRVYTAAEFHAQSSTSSTAPPPINTRGMSASIYDVPTTSREPSFPSMTTTTSFKETQASDHQPRKRKRSDDVTESDIMNVVDGMASLQTTTQHADTFARSQSTSHPPTYNRTELTATSAIQHRYATAAIARHIAVPGDPTSYSFHMPSVSLHDFTDENFQADITTFARHLQSFHHSHQPPQQDEIMWEYTFSTVLDGFGATMPQLYPTSGIGVTILHDEMLDSSAFNYMTSPSEGAALWITVKMGDLRSFFSLTEINELMRLGCHPNKFHIGRTLDKFITGKIPMQFLIQQPGQLVYTPAATGAMHMVITYGTLVEKLTWNYTFTQHGAAYSIAQWQTSQPYNAFITDGNTTMANHAVLPLYTMQQRGYDFGLHRHMTQLAERVSVFMRTAPHGTTILRFTDIQPHTTSIMSSSGFCTHCFHRLDWLLIRRAGMEDACIHCFFQEQ